MTFACRLAVWVNTFVGNGMGGENPIKFVLVVETVPKAA